jgi:hypothetical protein
MWTPPPAAISPKILAACQEINDGDVLRIHGEFGTFEGLASGADSTGIFGLRSRNAIDADPFSGQLEWEQIMSVEVQEKGTRRGAISGALIGAAIGLVGGTVAVVLDQTGGFNTFHPNPNWGIVPTAVGAVLGGSIGAKVGASQQVWRRVYP